MLDLEGKTIKIVINCFKDMLMKEDIFHKVFFLGYSLSVSIVLQFQ